MVSSLFLDPMKSPPRAVVSISRTSFSLAVPETLDTVSAVMVPPTEAEVCRVLTAFLMSPLAMYTRESMAPSSMSRFSDEAIFSRNSRMSSSFSGRNLKTALLDWMGSMILDE